MPKLVRSKTRSRAFPGREAAPRGIRKRSLFTLFLLLLVWSIILGWGMAMAMDVQSKVPIAQMSRPTANSAATETMGTVDPVISRLELGQQLYLDNCSTCHIAVPPAVLPMETWKNLLQDTQQHYGKQLPRIITPSLLLIWDYVRTYSRPQLEKETVPYRVTESRYLKALHPRVELPQPVKLSSCVTCHLGANQYNFRELTPGWENSP